MNTTATTTDVNDQAMPAPTSMTPPPAFPETVDPPLPKIIPPTEPDRRRTIVLCFDGTGDQFDADVRIGLLAIYFRYAAHFLSFVPII